MASIFWIREILVFLRTGKKTSLSGVCRPIHSEYRVAPREHRPGHSGNKPECPGFLMSEGGNTLWVSLYAQKDAHECGKKRMNSEEELL